MSAPESDPNPLAVLSPPHYVINDENHGGYVVIATWTMMSYMAMTVLVRIARNLTIAAWAADDYLICIAAATGLTQSGILHKAVAHGLGQRKSNLQDHEIELYNQFNYVYQILFIATICFSKLSLLSFITRLIPSPRNVLGSKILMGIIASWGTATVFSVAFQCALPTPWDTAGNCKDLNAIYYSAGIIDFFTDCAITILPILTLWNIQMEKGPKNTVMAVFVVRICTCVAEAVRLFYLRNYLQATDQPYQNTDLAIWTQAVTNLSIATACIPCLKPFLSSMRSGVFNTALPTGFTTGLTYTLDSSNTTNKSSLSQELYGNTKKKNITQTVVESGSQVRSESKTRLTEDRIYKTIEFTMSNGDANTSGSKGSGRDHRSDSC